jgi:hypothetical protein
MSPKNPVTPLGTQEEVLFLISAHLVWSKLVSIGAEYSRISTDTRNNATNDQVLSENVCAPSSFVWGIWVFSNNSIMQSQIFANM